MTKITFLYKATSYDISVAQRIHSPRTEVLDTRNLEGISKNAQLTPDVQHDLDVSG